MTVTPTIVFASDYGLADPFVGLCHAVIAEHAPAARVIDLTHAVPPQNVRAGAVILADCLPWLPAQAIVLAVVDPGVGTSRRGVVVAAGAGPQRRLLVGPDNGLLVPLLRTLERPTAAWTLLPPSGEARTFDGRDVFAPAAARLAAGAAPETLGEPCDPSTLVPLALPDADVADGAVSTEVVHIDGFGNLQLSAGSGRLEEAGLPLGVAVDLRCGAVARTATLCRTFAELAPGHLGILPDAFGRLQVAVNQGSAARLLGAGVGDPVSIFRPG